MKLDVWKILITLTWLLILVSPLGLLPPPWGDALGWIGIGLLVVHGAELAVFRKTIFARPEPRLVQVAMTLLFGIFYWRDFPGGQPTKT